MPTQIADVIQPDAFTAYLVQNSLLSTALYQSGVALPNGEMDAQLSAGAEFFTVPYWNDLPDVEADITNDNPAILSTTQKVTASKQVVRKSFLHASWSEASLASELSGSSALERVQSRVQAYWDRQFEKRLIASLMGVLYSNVAHHLAFLNFLTEIRRNPLSTCAPTTDSWPALMVKASSEWRVV